MRLPRRRTSRKGRYATRWGTFGLATVLVGLGSSPSAALAVEPCGPGQPEKRTIVSGRGLLESAIVDPKGRLFFTDDGIPGVVRMDSPEAEPVTLATGIGDALGGLAMAPDGKLILGVGNSIAGGVTGNVAPRAKLVRIDPDTGAVEPRPLAEGLQMANGVEQAPDGAVYASNDFGLGIDRIAPDGSVQLNWANVFSPNGLAIDSSGRYLFAAQTFQPAAVARIEIANPSNVETYVAASGADIGAGPDGMTIDSLDRLLVATNAGGELWRVGTDRTICSLASGMGQPSDVAVGRGTRGFARGSAWVVSFSGNVYEVAGVEPPAVDPPARAIPPTLRFRPLSVRVRGGRVAFTPRLYVGETPIRRRLRVRAGRIVRAARTGRRLSIPVGRGIRKIGVAFTYGGLRRGRAILARR